MTYAKRIERVTRALASVSDEEWERTRAETKEYFRAQARAADAAVLEAIREPTEEMIVAGRTARAAWTIRDIWDAMHVAIPREEKEG